MMLKNIYIITVTVIVILLLYQFNYYQSSNIKPGRDIKHILYWNKVFSHKDFYLGLGDIFNKCPVKNCFATSNKRLMDVDKFDAILFHGAEYDFVKWGAPARRSPHQVYVFENLEAPVHYPVAEAFENFFNWTMTYRRDSDVVRLYGSFGQRKKKYVAPSLDVVKRKTRKIAWFVSNCNTPSKRDRLYRKINGMIPVDVYGGCGKLSCPRTIEKDCYDLLEMNYKFYLSFENSLCDDYVSEKLYKVLDRNVVPIVYGGGDYKVYAPPKTVIDVLKFDSISSLVDYILRLDQNITEYMEYFKWKEDYEIDYTETKALCDLCRKLNEPITYKVYADIRAWWEGGDNKVCKDVPDIVGL